MTAEHLAMNAYGSAAVAAVGLYHSSAALTPEAAWAQAWLALFPDQPSSHTKGCPKGAFLGLCAAGLVAGIPPGEYTRSVDNRRYAVTAADLIRRDPACRADRPALWRQATAPRTLVENSQLDVVFALWDAGLLARPQKG